jgi:hypothetical protein
MPNRESPVAVAERHIAEAERRVARERELLAEPERDRHTAMAGHAHKILDVLQESLRLARIHLQFEREHSPRG